MHLLDGDWSYAADYVKLPRSIIAALRTDPNLLTLFAVLLDRARYHSGSFATERGDVSIAVGQAIVGRGELAKACGQGEQTIRSGMLRLQSLGLLTSKSTNRGTVVTLCRFEETYPPDRANQPANQPAGQPAGNQLDRAKSTSRSTSTGAQATLDDRAGFAAPPSSGQPADQPAARDDFRREPTSKPTSKVTTNRDSSTETGDERLSRESATRSPRSSKQPLPPEPLQLSETLRALVESNSNSTGAIKRTPREVRSWAVDLENLHRVGPSYDDIAEVLAWLGTSHAEAGYRPRVLCARDVRSKWDRLLAARQREQTKGNSAHGRAEPKRADEYPPSGKVDLSAV